MKYEILSAETRESLIRSVNQYLHEGWEPLGGVVLSQDRDRWINERKGYSETDVDVTWAQALIQQEKP